MLENIVAGYCKKGTNCYYKGKTTKKQKRTLKIMTVKPKKAINGMNNRMDMTKTGDVIQKLSVRKSP